MSNEAYAEKICNMIRNCEERGIKVVCSDGQIAFYDKVEYESFIEENYTSTENDDELVELASITPC